MLPGGVRLADEQAGGGQRGSAREGRLQDGAAGNGREPVGALLSLSMFMSVLR